MTKSHLFIFLILFGLFIYSPQISSAADSIKISVGSFKDQKRDRVIPYKLYSPTYITGPTPIVIFSHGLGGSTAAAPYLGETLAAHGYFAFHIQHRGSDTLMWEEQYDSNDIRRDLRDAVKKASRDMSVAISRYEDIPSVIDQLEIMNANGNYKGLLDINKIGMIGHGFGARGVMAAAGEHFGNSGTAFIEPRVRAGIALSPNLPAKFEGGEEDSLKNIKKHYKDINIPLFHITGTEDDDMLGIYGKDFKFEDRLVPYENISRGDQYLLVIKDADHSVFGGLRHKLAQENERHYNTIGTGAVLFFDAYLKGDIKAKNKLQKNYRAQLMPNDMFKFK